MKKNSIATFLYLAGVLFILGCEGPAGPAGVQGVGGLDGKDGGYDKQLRLDFNIIDTLQSRDTLGTVSSQQFTIVKFNKAYYVNIDSIIFLAFLRSSDTNAVCTLELFNVTDNVGIDSSLIQSKDTTYKLVESKNIFKDLPSKEITLAVKISSSKQGTLVEALQPVVYLYRR